MSFKIVLDSAPQRDLGTGDLTVVAGGSLGSLTKVNATEYIAVVLPSPNLATTNTGVLKLSVQASATNPLTDAAGNPLATANSPEVSFDNKAPVVSLFSESIKDLPFNANFPITANTTDTDLSTVTASFLGSSTTLSRPSNANGKWQVELLKTGLSPLDNGYYTFKLTSTDTAGNSTDTMQVFKFDRGDLRDLWLGNTPTGNDANNLFINTTGNQSFQGNGGSDSFVWLSRDAGKPGTPDIDTIVDFSLTNDGQGDRLNLRDLLGGVTAANLDKYLKISAVDTNVDTDTLPDAVQVAISRLGQFTATGDAAQADQLIVLSNLALPAASNLVALAEALNIDWSTTLSQPLFG